MPLISGLLTKRLTDLWEMKGTLVYSLKSSSRTSRITQRNPVTKEEEEETKSKIYYQLFHIYPQMCTYTHLPTDVYIHSQPVCVCARAPQILPALTSYLSTALSPISILAHNSNTSLLCSPLFIFLWDSLRLTRPICEAVDGGFGVTIGACWAQQRTRAKGSDSSTIHPQPTLER